MKTTWLTPSMLGKNDCEYLIKNQLGKVWRSQYNFSRTDATVRANVSKWPCVKLVECYHLPRNLCVWVLQRGRQLWLPRSTSGSSHIIEPCPAGAATLVFLEPRLGPLGDMGWLWTIAHHVKPGFINPKGQRVVDLRDTISVAKQSIGTGTTVINQPGLP